MQYEVETSGIRSHAVSLAGIEADVRSASTAGQSTLDSSAFGVVNAPLAAMVGLLSGAMTLAIGNAADDLGETVSILRAQAAQYDEDDRGARDRVRGAGR